MSGRPLEVSAQEPSILLSEDILDAWLPPDSSSRKKKNEEEESACPETHGVTAAHQNPNTRWREWWWGTRLMLPRNPSADDHSLMESFSLPCHRLPLRHSLYELYSTHRLGDFQTLAPSLFRYQDWLLGNQSAPLSLPPAGSQLTTSRTGQTELSSDQISAQRTWMKVRRGKSGLRTMQKNPVPGSYVLYK